MQRVWDRPSSRKKRIAVGDLGAVATRTDGGRARRMDGNSGSTDGRGQWVEE
ncbi:uncharacterized protein DS421_18g628470 [Arachis hypogaea]|nr:uncharacterized protein DS421_18g628470 [Arachis hypogaea]